VLVHDRPVAALNLAPLGIGLCRPHAATVAVFMVSVLLLAHLAADSARGEMLGHDKRTGEHLLRAFRLGSHLVSPPPHPTAEWGHALSDVGGGLGRPRPGNSHEQGKGWARSCSSSPECRNTIRRESKSSWHLLDWCLRKWITPLSRKFPCLPFAVSQESVAALRSQRLLPVPGTAFRRSGRSRQRQSASRPQRPTSWPCAWPVRLRRRKRGRRPARSLRRS